MADAVVAAQCRGCLKKYRIPKVHAEKTVLCKQCGHPIQVLSEQDAAGPKKIEATAPAARSGKPVSAPTKDDTKKSNSAKPSIEREPVKLIPISSPRKRYFKPAVVMPVVFFLVLAAGGILLYVLFGEQILKLWVGEANSHVALQQSHSLLQEALQKTLPSGAMNSSRLTSTQPKSSAPNQRNRPNDLQTSRLTGPFPGRALLIGIKNYPYLQPINPAYAPDLTRDPLGLHGLKRALLVDTAFPQDQVLEISDVAQEMPVAPTKPMIEATLRPFLANCRPQDRVVVVFVGHIGMVKDKGYLFPIDADDESVDRLIALDELLGLLQKCPGRQKLLILDPSPLDPGFTRCRNAPTGLDAKLFKQLEKPPEGVQIWLSCKPEQHSYLPYKDNTNGSAFIHWLSKLSAINNPDNWRLIEKHPGIKEHALPMLLLEQTIAGQTQRFVQEKLQLPQTPILLGQEKPYKGNDVASPPPPVTMVGADAKGDQQALQLLLAELSLINDPMRDWKSFPVTFVSSPLDPKYASDRPIEIKSMTDLRSKWKDKPLRLFCLDIVQQLNKKEDFRMSFTQADVNNKRLVESLQQAPASSFADLMELVERAKEMKDARSKESPRWQAHFDYYHARLLGKTITVSEYNFVLGNSIRKDSPTLHDAKAHDGWVIMPQEKLQQSESRSLNSERKKILERLIKEHPNTPWERIARCELATYIGLTLHEMKLRR